MTLAQYLALRAVQASLIVTLFLTLPFFMALLIRWGGTTLRQLMGW